ncbi:MAG: hypothetical protein RLY86_4423 [Pseudomonadota bacterium]|jgi:predicted AAA+ superfamily ATPase
MIPRRVSSALTRRLEAFPAVTLLGPRQVGKTTLSLVVAEGRPSLYLDLESDSDQAKLADPEAYLSRHTDKLVILDEVQRRPGLFQNLRGLIDQGRRAGRRGGQFLLLGSASLDLLRQSSETLAGRISHLELGPIDLTEVGVGQRDRLWVRGGFPDSLLAADDAASLQWRRDFIRTYLERDVPQLGSRIPAETLRRFWTMLAHHQGQLLNASELGRSLGVDHKTIASYLDLLVDLLLVRRLAPWHANTGKRLVKSPKVYVRDSGLVHALLGLGDIEAVLGHPVAGASWEGMVVETLAGLLPAGGEAYFYRTSAGAEIDLLLRFPDGRLWAVEVKRSSAPKLSRGFHLACADLGPERRIVVHGAAGTFPMGGGVEAMGLAEVAALLL